ncbi:MAG: hypothetical protein KGQ41_01770 [Alphaproteobacteria bacterium]|nr:hypothetical protein [Alphaproteobacteria bacterium]
MKPASISARLLVSLALLFALTVFLATALAVHSTHHRIDADYDSQLIAESHTILMFVHEDLEENGQLDNYKLDSAVLSFLPEEERALHEYVRWRGLRIWKNGKLAAQSEGAKDLGFPMAPTGFSEAMHGQDKWRIYAISMPTAGIVVETMENLSNRDRLISDIIEEMTEPAIALLPVLGILLYVAVWFGLRGVRRMAHQLARRAPDDMAPLKGDLPTELRPLQKSLNSLLSRLENSITREREFIDNAAHELRTPLAAMRLQGQLIDHAKTDAERADAAKSLIETIDRTSTLFNQLLTLSRIQHQKLEAQSLALANIVREVVSERALLAAEKDIDISLEGPEDAAANAQPDMLKILLGVLIDNAIRYTPAAGRIAITVDNGKIDIRDNGPGIPESEREKVFERFYRARRDQQGSGLGLAIAKQVCDFLKADIALGQGLDGAGLGVSLVFKDEHAHRA